MNSYAKQNYSSIREKWKVPWKIYINCDSNLVANSLLIFSISYTNNKIRVHINNNNNKILIILKNI